MMGDHLSIDQLLDLQESGVEPGMARTRAHLDSCKACRLEADRLAQRSARLRALPSLRPPRDNWGGIRTRVEAERRRSFLRRAALVGLAAAATLLLAVWLRPLAPVAPASTGVAEARSRSNQLEQFLQAYDADSRVTNGRTAHLAVDLEDRIALVDRQLEAAQLLEARQRDPAMLQLWRQRVGLLDALVDVHLTQASAVGF
ncbi:MAG: hypothetical protein OEW17_06340 [Gemmatimonadota bacterium]|nr:hypothetical protein [Gemmatimonadota bacterium]MDH4348404.1 hypothetical protein [Gemmatimonadota bacterium]MDH5284746.1 hypothetical protein [Gemmatimonadota bacterium]